MGWTSRSTNWRTMGHNLRFSVGCIGRQRCVQKPWLRNSQSSVLRRTVRKGCRQDPLHRSQVIVRDMHESLSVEPHNLTPRSHPESLSEAYLRYNASTYLLLHCRKEMVYCRIDGYGHTLPGMQPAWSRRQTHIRSSGWITSPQMQSGWGRDYI